MTAKRRRFLELLAHGSSLTAACREVKVSRATGNLWKNDTVVRRKDGTVEVLPPLEPLASRTITPRFLSGQKRVQIADLASRGHGPTAIGQELGRSPSTILPLEFNGPSSTARLVWRGIGVGALNPKSLVLFVPFLPQFAADNTVASRGATGRPGTAVGDHRGSVLHRLGGHRAADHRDTPRPGQRPETPHRGCDGHRRHRPGGRTTPTRCSLITPGRL
jgi:hypothetical protein